MKQPSAKYTLTDEQWTIECGKAYEQYLYFTNGLKAKGVNIDAATEVFLKEDLDSYYFAFGEEETVKMLQRFSRRVGMKIPAYDPEAK